MRPSLTVFSALLVLACLPGLAFSATKRIVLDRDGVRHFYTEGEFDQAIALLEDFERTPGNWSREDSIMVYKYLGVMFAASPDSREKGRTYFYKLIKLHPNARLDDMYVNTLVQDIFTSTAEYIALNEPGADRTDPKPRTAVGTGAEPIKPPGPDAPPERNRDKPGKVRKKSSHLGWWIGGIGLIVGGAGGYYWYGNRPRPADSEIRAKVY